MKDENKEVALWYQRFVELHLKYKPKIIVVGTSCGRNYFKEYIVDNKIRGIKADVLIYDDLKDDKNDDLLFEMTKNNHFYFKRIWWTDEYSYYYLNRFFTNVKTDKGWVVVLYEPTQEEIEAEDWELYYE